MYTHKAVFVIPRPNPLRRYLKWLFYIQKIDHHRINNHKGEKLMKKKFFAIFLSVLLCLPCFASCDVKLDVSGIPEEIFTSSNKDAATESESVSQESEAKTETALGGSESLSESDKRKRVNRKRAKQKRVNRKRVKPSLTRPNP